MPPSGIRVGRAVACALVAVSFAAHAQPAGRAPVANQTPGKQAQNAVDIVAQDGQLYERFGSGGFLKIEATGSDEHVMPKCLVCLTFRRTNGKISSVSVNHSDDFIGVKTAKANPCHGVLERRNRGAYGGIFAFVGDEDESDLAKAARELSGMKIYAEDGHSS